MGPDDVKDAAGWVVAHRLVVTPEAALEGLTGAACRKADAEAVRRYTGYAIGGVPPAGFPHPIETYIDRDLLQYAQVWAAAGTPHHVFPISPAQLIALTGGAIADLKA